MGVRYKADSLAPYVEEPNKTENVVTFDQTFLLFLVFLFPSLPLIVLLLLLLLLLLLEASLFARRVGSMPWIRLLFRAGDPISGEYEHSPDGSNEVARWFTMALSIRRPAPKGIAYS